MAKGSRPGGSLGANKEQRASMDKMRQKLPIGGKGTGKFGGDYSTIKNVSFSKGKNGEIEYSVTGERFIHAEKSVVMGTGSTPARIRTVVSKGVIMPSGLIKSTGSTSSETIVKGGRNGKRK